MTEMGKTPMPTMSLNGSSRGILCILGLAMLGTVLLAPRTAAAAGAKTERAQKFVTSIAVTSLSILREKAKNEEARYPKFRDLVQSSFDSSAIGRFVVGNYWGKASATQIEQFQAAFKEALVRIYLARLSGYTDEDFKITGVEELPDSVIVHSTIESATTHESSAIDWHVVQAGSKDQVIDVIIDGVSTSMTTKQDYSSVLRSADGNLEILTAKIASHS